MQEEINLNRIWINFSVNITVNPKTITTDLGKGKFFYHNYLKFKNANLYGNIIMLVWFTLSLSNPL